MRASTRDLERQLAAAGAAGLRDAYREIAEELARREAERPELERVVEDIRRRGLSGWFAVDGLSWDGPFPGEAEAAGQGVETVEVEKAQRT